MIAAVCRWSPDSIPRYSLAPVMLGMVFLAVVLEKTSIGKYGLSAFMLFATVLSLPYLLFDPAQPIANDAQLAHDLDAEVSYFHFSNVSRREYRRQTLFLEKSEDYDIMMETMRRYEVTKIGIQYRTPFPLAVYPYLYEWRDERYDVQYLDPIFVTEKADLQYRPQAILRFEQNDGEALKDITWQGVVYVCVEKSYAPWFDVWYGLYFPKEMVADPSPAN